MRINVTEPEQCCCVTCVQHRTLCNVIRSSFTSVPVSSGHVQALGDSSPLGSTSTSSPVQISSPVRSGTATPLAPPVTTSVDSEPAQPIDSPANATVTPVSSEPAQALGPTASGSLPVPVFGSPPFVTSGPSIFCSSQTPVTNITGSGTSAASRPSIFGPMQASTFCSGASAASTSSTFDAVSPMQAPAQASAPNTCPPPFSFLPPQDSGKTASAYPSPFSQRGDFARTNVGISPAVSTPTPTRSFGETHFSSPFGPRHDFPKTGVVFPRINQENTLSSSLPGFGVNYLPRYPSNLFGPNQQTKQGSRYPRYSPTLNGQDKYFSISASNSHGHKSHEELRWEDYKNGDKGERPNAIFPSSTASPSLFASPSIPDHLQRRTTGTTQQNMTSPTSGYTACGATSSSSSSSYLGFNVATNPLSAATCLPGFYPTSGYCPLMFGLPNLAAQGTSTPAVQPYPMILGTPNLAALGTTTNPAVQLYPMILGSPNLAAQGTSTPAVQLYPMILGSPNLAAQGTSTPAVQPYPMMFGSPKFAAQGTSTPAVQPYPVMFGSPNLAAQGTSTPAVQPYPVMFGSPNLAAQGTTPAIQPYLGGVLPFANMNLQ